MRSPRFANIGNMSFPRSGVRSNHVHAVVSHDGPPEKIVEAFKSYATRALRRDGFVNQETKVWARHASTRYLWKATIGRGRPKLLPLFSR
jgi:REP element-mobilizing transposase RayT